MKQSSANHYSLVPLQACALSDNSAGHCTRKQENNSEPDDKAPISEEDYRLKAPILITEGHDF